ncbi:hypothetical protein [Chloroherpeton thalassium]|uniref:hypothetical protein n=1 Tax=Chloroherpeton thalassium TaxID=100716 RepID=UPI000315F698|nr:hypothetical protein [Chloroherpeton thalassium]
MKIIYICRPERRRQAHKCKASFFATDDKNEPRHSEPLGEEPNATGHMDDSPKPAQHDNAPMAIQTFNFFRIGKITRS